MKVRFHRLAQAEMGDSVRYYEGEYPGLGSELLDAVLRAVGFLREYPYGAPTVSGKLRRKLIARFPFDLVYAVGDDGLFILAVANLRRRPL